MTRWRDLGIVEDSEDEDLAHSITPGSSHGHGDPVATDFSSPTNGLWEKGSPPPSTRILKCVSIPVTKAIGRCLDSGSDEDEHPESSATSERLGLCRKDKRTGVLASRSHTQNEARALSPDGEQSTVPTPLIHGQASSPAAMDIVPIQQAPSETLKPQPSISIPVASDEDSESSALSSPMSSACLSPPPELQAQFRSPRRLPDINDVQKARQMSTSPPHDWDAFVSDNALLNTSNIRPGLRVRKEKQLHPYLYDRVQYQHQWKSRGLKPVHFRVVDKMPLDTQDESFSEDEDQSQERPTKDINETRYALSYQEPFPFLTDNHRPNEKTPTGIEPPQDEDFLDIDTLFNKGHDDMRFRNRKRRKLTPTRRAKKTAASRLEQCSKRDLPASTSVYDIPISPSPSSQDSMDLPSLSPQFQMPFGLTPVHLPTPQDSSATKPPVSGNDKNVSDDELPLRHSPPRAGSRILSQGPIVVSSEHSESDSEQVSSHDNDVPFNQSNMRREQKRLKGVLPASWLKIDLQAQNVKQPQQSSAIQLKKAQISTSHTLSSSKGVAQRITHKCSKNAATPTDRISLSDSSDTDLDSSPSSKQSFVQPRLASLEGNLAISLEDAMVAEDEMELDWIDPMLPSSTRKTSSNEPTRRRRQPRITDVMDVIPSIQQDRVNTDRSHRQKSRNQSSNIKSNAGGSVARRKTSRTTPKLSILDTQHSSDAQVLMPTFIKLASRQSRKRVDRGQQSPGAKIVRLATKTDTDEALETLVAWRNGTIEVKQIDPDTEIYDRMVEDVEKHPLRAFDRMEKSRRKPLRDKTNFQDLTNSTSKDDWMLHRLSTSPRLYPPNPPHPNAHRKRHVPPFHDVSQTKNNDDPSIHQSTTSDRSVTRYRGAQLESLEKDFDGQHRNAAFQRRMNCLTEAVACRAPQSTLAAPQIRRFAVQDNAPRDTQVQYQEAVIPVIDKAKSRPSQPFPKRIPSQVRKRPAIHVDVETLEYRQPEELLPNHSSPSSELASDERELQVLQGLRDFGEKYSNDFDTRPLAIGTFFHESTFIGSGELAAAIGMFAEDLNHHRGHISISLGAEVLNCGPWTEEVASGLSRIPGLLCEVLQTVPKITGSEHADSLIIARVNVERLLRSVARYFSKHLSFFDPIDREACSDALSRILHGILDLCCVTDGEPLSVRQIKRHCLSYAMVLAYLCRGIASHKTVPHEKKDRATKLLTTTVRQVAKSISPSDFNDLRICYERNHVTIHREAGIRDDAFALANIVVLRHCLGEDLNIFPLTEILQNTVNSSIRDLTSVSAFEQLWSGLFAMLPAFEIDMEGVLAPGSRFKQTPEDWNLVKKVIDRVLELYPDNASLSNASINEYLRTVLSRSYNLITHWGWRRSEAVLGSIYDFFARRGFAQLNHEGTAGSPSYLQDLEKQPSFELRPGDSAFHIFLKMLVVSLQNMLHHDTFSAKKIGAIAYRFIPNHGRTYRKDFDVEQKDVDSLRHHLDLLCTLYYASPAGFRFSVSLVRDMVDYANSHREACRQSVRAWTNLVSFQASTAEPIQALHPLIEWLGEIISITATQFRLARIEGEQALADARNQGISGVTEEVVNITISSNQRQITATIVDAFAGLKRALRCASSPAVVHVLIERSRFWSLFLPFDPTELRLLPALTEALEVTQAAFDAHERLSTDSGQRQEISEESQEYGDSSALQLLMNGGMSPSDSTPGISVLLLEPIGQLLSTVFGADAALDDNVLAKIVDIWVTLAAMTIKAGERNWSNFVDGYDANAWDQLRDTTQRRKYTSYFLSRVVQKAEDEIVDIEKSLLTSWLISLVDREAVLKYQHELTTALLNASEDLPLLKNLPFFSTTRDGRFRVTLQEFRQRRLSTISSVLSNMRTAFEWTTLHQPSSVQENRQIYADMLRSLMHAMKNNYLELLGGQNADAASANVQGAYVEFVQQVVSFLQQHITDICRIDPFFTDSSAFPLPVNDPTYVTGRMRSYIPRLKDSRSRKQLSVFFQSVLERSIVDEEQQYLIDQICAAATNVQECGDWESPSLRHVLLMAIFPPYICAALSTSSSWILASPVLESGGIMLSSLIHDVDLNDSIATDAALDMLESVFSSMVTTLAALVVNPDILLRASTLKTLQSIFNTTRHSLIPVRHIQHFRPNEKLRPMALIRQLYKTAHRIAKMMTSSEPTACSPNDDNLPLELNQQASVPWPDTTAFARDQVLESLNHWSEWDNGQYYLQNRSGPARPVEPRLAAADVERRRAQRATWKFQQSYERLLGGRGRRLEMDVGLDDLELGFGDGPELSEKREGKDDEGNYVASLVI